MGQISTLDVRSYDPSIARWTSPAPARILSSGGNE